jgi:hypothetical protein
VRYALLQQLFVIIVEFYGYDDDWHCILIWPCNVV